MTQIRQSDYDKIHPDFRGTWTTERTDLADWEQIRERHMGKRTMMSGNGRCELLIEGMHFEIIPD